MRALHRALSCTALAIALAVLVVACHARTPAEDLYGPPSDDVVSRSNAVRECPGAPHTEVGLDPVTKRYIYVTHWHGAGWIAPTITPQVFCP